MSARPESLDDRLGALRTAVADGSLRPEELAEEALAGAARHAGLRALLTIDAEGTRAASRRRLPGPLNGIPFAHKDLICTEGLKTTAGSRMLADFVPAYSATVHERLVAAGAVCLGKASLDEFGMGSSNEYCAFGPAGNPWAPDRVPGGSSGGSAALVAAGVVPFATGTDTGGSVRQPAAFCGVTGIKPTYGRISRHGVIAYASSLDQVGVLARSAVDCARVLAVLAGHDPRDATSLDLPVPDYVAACGEPVLAGRRVGLPRPYFEVDGIAPAVHAALVHTRRAFEAAGARVLDIELPHAGLALPAYYLIAPAEASSNLARYDGVRYGHRAAGVRDLEELYLRSRGEGFGPEVRRRILVGNFALASGYYDAYYRKALQARRRVAEDYRRAFAEVDLLLAPVTPTPAFRFGEKLADPAAMLAADVHTVAVNLAGLPAIAFPCGHADGLPIGAQLIGPRLSEALLLAAVAEFQRASTHHRARPPGVG